MAIVLQVSFAQSQCQSMGWANYDGQTYVGALTGGGNTTPVQVTTFAQLKSAAESSGSKVIYVMNDVGNGYKGTSGDVINIKSDKTVIGFKPGITVKCSWQVKSVSNVIVKNLILRGPGNSNSEQNWDCVNIQGSKRIWFDHCTVMEGEDGNFDVVKGSDNVTATWCKFMYVTGGEHNLSNLIGSSDNEEISHNKLNVTYAYCVWDNVNSRCPRTRYGKIHVLNCYFNQIGSACYAGFMSNVRVEGCFFESNVSNPTGLISTGGKAGIFAIDCNRGSTQTDGYNSVFVPPYQFQKFANSEVKAKLTNSTCGAGPTLTSPTDCGGCGTVVKDCNGDANGTAILDACGICTGGKTGKVACVKDCNGDGNGTATLDACGICIGGKTGLTSCIGALQGETACDIIGVKNESTNAGFTGTGYANTDNQMGAYATWIFQSASTQTVNMKIRFANGGTSPRNGALYVSGKFVRNVELVSTGTWDKWQTVDIQIPMAKGTNTVRIEAISAEGLANIDAFFLYTNGVTSSNCVLTKLDGESSDSFVFYPNPTENKLHFSKIVEFEILDFQGTVHIKGESEIVDVQNLSSGVYFLKIDGLVLKFIKI